MDIFALKRKFLYWQVLDNIYADTDIPVVSH